MVWRSDSQVEELASETEAHSEEVRQLQSVLHTGTKAVLEAVHRNQDEVPLPLPSLSTLTSLSECAVLL